MSLWQRHLLPYLIDHVMRSRRLDALRQQIAGKAHGRVLEIGIGSGLNLPFYGRKVEHLIGIDPSPELLKKAADRAQWLGFPVRFLLGSAEQLPLPDHSIDTVISSWTLCSIPRVEVALAEIARVLAPGGQFWFVEHGLSPDPRIAARQHAWTAVWRRLVGGCHLNRPIEALLRQAGLELDELQTGYLLPGPRPFTYHYVGCARHAAEPQS